jgi:hypothetical protein
MEGEDEEEEEEIVQNRKGPIIVTVVWLLKKEIGSSILLGEITKKQIFMCDANFAVDCCA